MTRPGALLAGLLAAGLVGHLLGGCGGTTTDAGNPEIEFDFTNGGQPFSFQGSIQVYSASALPGFYVPEPEDDSPPSDDRPVLSASSKGNVFIPLKPVTRFSLDSTRLAGASSFRVLFPRLPPSAADSEFQIVAESDPDGHDTIRTFNLYFRGRGNMSAFVRGISYDAKDSTYRDADGRPIETLRVELAPSAGYSGTVDTTGFGGKALVIFSPGSPIAAPVHGDSFYLDDLPRAELPARIVTEDGVVYDAEKLLDATRGEPGSRNNVLDPIVPVRSQDTLVVPPPGEELEMPVADPAGPLNFSTPLAVTLSSPDTGVTIYYTKDGSIPDRQSAKYTGPIVLQGNTSLMAVAYRAGSNHSPISSDSYTMVPPAPKATPGGREFRDSLVVSLFTAAARGTVRYTLDGSPPTLASPVYSRPLVLKTTTVLKAVTSVARLELSAILEERYILLPDTTLPDTTASP